MNNKKATILITGASLGIGLFTAKALRESGSFNLALCYSREESKQNLLSHFTENEDTLFIKCDVSQNVDIENAVNMTIEKFSAIDVLFNNAGIFASSPLMKTSDELFDSIIDINLRGAFRMLKAAGGQMLKQNSGVIVNTLSVTTKKPFYGCSAYSASKAGFLAMAEVFREEVRKYNIKVINVSPGATATDIWSKENLEKFGEKMMKAEDLGLIIKDIIINALNTSVVVEDITLRPAGGDL